MISLITCSYNNGSTIGDTLLSAGKQTVQFEYLVIDGGSSDNTIDLVKRSGMAGKIISEPDQGLYDALNKGVRLSSGDIIGFLHADDLFASPETLALVADKFHETGADAVYGDIFYVSEDLRQVKRNWKSGQPGNFATGWMPPHTALFVKRHVFEKVGGFRLDMGTAADYEWMLRAFHKNRFTLAYVPQVLVHMRVGGMSNEGLKSRQSALANDRKAWMVNGLGNGLLPVILKKLRKLPQYITFTGE